MLNFEKKSDVEEAEDPEREPKEMAMMFSRLKEGIRMIQAGIRMLEDTAFERAAVSDNHTRNYEAASLYRGGSERDKQSFLFSDFSPLLL